MADYIDLTPEEYQEHLRTGYVPQKVTQSDQYDSWVDTPNYAPAGGGSYLGGQPYHTPYTGAAWGSWDNKWSKANYNFDPIEQRLKRKKQIISALDDFKISNNIIAKSYIASDTSINRKKGLYSISVDNSKTWKEDMKKLQTGVDTWKKIPSSEKVRINSYLMSELINNFSKGEVSKMFMNTQLYADGNCDKIDELTNVVNSILSQKAINDEDIDTLINSIPDSIKKDIVEQLAHGGVSTLVDRYESVKNIKKSTRLTQQPDKYVKFPHLVKGKRINKGFIQKTDYRALKTREKIVIKQKKLLIVLDASGSMTYISGRSADSPTPYQASINFIGSLMDSKMFTIEVMHSTDRRVIDATNSITKWNTGAAQVVGTGSSEGFELLTDRLGSITRDEDYVLVLTDMEVPDNAEENLKAFIGSKKHLVLSFANKGTFKGNVRLVKTYEDMMAVVTTLLN